MAGARGWNPDPDHVWAIEPVTEKGRIFSAIPEEQYDIYHEDHLCENAPDALRRVHLTEARERQLEPCPECAETDEDGGGLLDSIL